MSVGLTLFKLGLTGAMVGGVIWTARHYQRQGLARARARTAVPQLPGPPGATPGPAPLPESPTPTIPQAPVPEPEEFPAPDDCVWGVYSRMPIPPEAQIYESADAPARLVLKDMRLHIDYRAQPKIMLDLLDRIDAEPSVRSVMVRRALEEVAPDCDWWIPEDQMLPSQQLVYQSAIELALAAEVETGWDHPSSARKNMIPREYLGIPSTGVLNLTPGQAVELLVVEGPAMEYGEHVIAKTLQGGPNPRVAVVDTFMGNDVAPLFSPQHGFGVGTQVVLESKPPTSVYRVYPKDWS